MLRKREQKGFTLIELLIVIAIIGILAAIAIPMYRAQTIKARLTEVTNGMSNIASAVAAYYQENEDWPSTTVPNKASVQTSFGVGLGNLTRMSECSVSDAGVITATVTAISGDVDNSTLMMIPTTNTDGSVTWSWSGSIKPSYLPTR